MFESTILSAPPAVGFGDTVERAHRLLDGAGLAGIAAALAPFADAGADGVPGLAAVLERCVALVIDAFRADSRSAAAYAALAALPAALAARMFDRTLAGIFGDRERDIRAVNETGAITLVGLLSAAGAHEQAAALISQVREYLIGPGVRHAAWVARCRWAGCTPAPAAYLDEAALSFPDAAAAEARIDAAPLDLAAHRARIRFALAAGDVLAVDALIGAALALPLGDADKQLLAPELALLAAMHAACGDTARLGADRLRWALAAASGVTAAAAALLDARMAAGALPFLDPAESAAAAAALRNCVTPSPAGAAPAVTGYPMRNGKPHVDIVWLEITNHCNQKCTFCPDMFREDARTWLPLDQVKNLIDQLCDTISVGSMQLNAYGEPLLHPNIAEILAYIRERDVRFPTYFTSHGMTLVEKKLKQLSNNYPAGIAISLHNDSQASYAATRSHKIGDYDTLVARVTDLLRQMVAERAPSHLRLYQMVSNGAEDARVDPVTRHAFPDTPERLIAHVRKWEAIAEAIAAAAPPESAAQAQRTSDADLRGAFKEAMQGDSTHLPILTWRDVNGGLQRAFMSARPVGTYANLLLEYDPRWSVERKLVTGQSCGFTATPSLAIFATGRLGICCLDLNSTATFGALSDFPDLRTALTSPQALQIFAQLSNGIATSRGCQVCLGGTERHCASKNLPGPPRPAGHFAPEI